MMRTVECSFNHLPRDPIPENADRGARLSVRLTVESLHDRTGERMGLTEDDIERKRDRGRERIAEMRDRTG